MENCIGTIPIHLKMTLTTKEAAEYSNIGINKIDSMLLHRKMCARSHPYGLRRSLNSSSVKNW